MEEAPALAPPAAADPAPPPLQAHGRAEVDTSAPFESVREAVDRFGGAAAWSEQLRPLLAPPSKKHEEEIEPLNLEEQTAELEKELIVKEKEALEVLQELEMTKRIIADLKLAVQNATLQENHSVSVKTEELCDPVVGFEHDSEALGADEDGKAEDNCDRTGSMQETADEPLDLILIELNNAKQSLQRATTEVASVRTSVETISTCIKKEKILLQRSRDKLATNTAIVASLEDSVNQTTEKLHTLRDLQNRSKDPLDIFTEIKKMADEVNGLRKFGNAARSEVIQLMAEIEQTKASIKTAEIQCQAAEKMEAAARAAESLALAEIYALVSTENLALCRDNAGGVTLSMEEYLMLISKAQEADLNSREKLDICMHQIGEVNNAKLLSAQKLEEAKAEAEECKAALEEALKRLDAANKGKLAVEEALRRWRSEHGQKTQSMHRPVKFKTSAAHQRKDPVSSGLATAEGPAAYRHTMSIGQILSMKLMGPEEYAKSVSERQPESPVVSLGQILDRKHRIAAMDDEADRKQMSPKRKKAFSGLSLILAKQNKGKKRPLSTEEPVCC